MPMHPDRPLVIKTGVQFTTKVRWVTSHAGEGGQLSRESSLGSLSEDAAAHAAPSLPGEHWCWEGMDTSQIDPRGMIPVGWSAAHMTKCRAGWGSALFLEAAGFW